VTTDQGAAVHSTRGLDDLAVTAARHGFWATPCPSCSTTPAGQCANCRGSRRLWRDGCGSLDDAGLDRFLGMMLAAERHRLAATPPAPALDAIAGATPRRLTLATPLPRIR
jgi:hypothetical protein